MKRRLLSTCLALAIVLAIMVPLPALADITVITADVGNPVTVDSVTPNNGNPGQNVAVTIAGSNFVVGQPVTVEVSAPGVVVADVIVNSSTNITATFQIATGSTATAGGRNVTVTQLGSTDTNNGAFTVNAGTTVNDIPDINLGYLTLGGTKSNSVALSNLVVTNSTTWAVTVSGNNGGYLRDGSSNLMAAGAAKFMIGKTSSTGPSDVGFAYGNADGTSPLLYYSQDVPSNATPGSYSITLTFTASVQ